MIMYSIKYGMHNQPKSKATMGRAKGSKNVSVLLKNKIIDLIKSGMFPSEVPNFYYVSRNTLKNIMRHSRQVTPAQIKKPGRLRKLGPRCVG